MNEPWSDERLDAAFETRAASRIPPSGLTDDILSSVGRGGGKRLFPMPILGVAVLIAILAVAGIVSRPHAAAGSLDLEPAPGGLTTLRIADLQFEFPAAWRAWEVSSIYSFGAAYAVLGTFVPQDRCVGATLDYACFSLQRLDPGTLSVIVGSAAFRGETIFQRQESAVRTARPLTIGGFPGLVEDRGRIEGNNYASDADITWEVSFPNSITQAYTIEARIRQPGVDEARADLERLIGSFRFPDFTPSTAAPDRSRQVAIGQRLIEELALLDRKFIRDGYGTGPHQCFGTQPDIVATGEVSNDSSGGRLAETLGVRCSWSIQPSVAPYLELVMEIDWTSLGGGRAIETVWVGENGEPVHSIQTGDPLPARQPGSSMDP